MRSCHTVFFSMHLLDKCPIQGLFLSAVSPFYFLINGLVFIDNALCEFVSAVSMFNLLAELQFPHRNSHFLSHCSDGPVLASKNMDKIEKKSWISYPEYKPALLRKRPSILFIFIIFPH